MADSSAVLQLPSIRRATINPNWPTTISTISTLHTAAKSAEEAANKKPHNNHMQPSWRPAPKNMEYQPRQPADVWRYTFAVRRRSASSISSAVSHPAESGTTPIGLRTASATAILSDSIITAASRRHIAGT
jgi:hypothetical protein